MSQQQSQKRGVRSEDQKMGRARDGYEPIPPGNPVAGAFGDHHGNAPTDEDQALKVGATNEGIADRGEEE